MTKDQGQRTKDKGQMTNEEKLSWSGLVLPDLCFRDGFAHILPLHHPKLTRTFATATRNYNYA